MVLTTRQFSSQQYDASSIQGQGPIVLARAAACQIVGLLVQLGELSQFALDIYQALGYETHQAATRIDAVAERTSDIEAKLSIYSQQIEAAPPSRFFHNEGTMQWKRADKMTNDLFAPTSRSIPLSKLVSATFAPPTIGLLNEFAGKDCTLLYSDPGFFFKQWVLEEAKKFEQQREERKKMRQSRPKRERKTVQKVEVQGIEVKVYNKDGREFGTTTQNTAARAVSGVASVAAPRPVQVQVQPQQQQQFQQQPQQQPQQPQLHQITPQPTRIEIPSSPVAKQPPVTPQFHSPTHGFDSTPSASDIYNNNSATAAPPTPHAQTPAPYDDYYPEPSFSVQPSFTAQQSFNEPVQDNALDAILAAKQQSAPATHHAPPPARTLAPPPPRGAFVTPTPPPPTAVSVPQAHIMPSPPQSPQQHYQQQQQQQQQDYYEAPSPVAQQSYDHYPTPPSHSPMHVQPPPSAPTTPHAPSPAAAALLAAGRPELRSPTPQTPSNNGPPEPRNALLGALRGGIQLRKAEEPAAAPPAKPAGGGLLADIKSRPMLRKASVVATSNFQQKPPAQQQGPSGLSAVMDIIARRKAIADSESESEDDDDDWD